MNNWSEEPWILVLALLTVCVASDKSLVLVL